MKKDSGAWSRFRSFDNNGFPRDRFSLNSLELIFINESLGSLVLGSMLLYLPLIMNPYTRLYINGSRVHSLSLLDRIRLRLWYVKEKRLIKDRERLENYKRIVYELNRDRGAL